MLTKGTCVACARKRHQRRMTSISDRRVFKLEDGENIRSKLSLIKIYLESKLFEMNSIKFNIVINPTYQKGVGDDVKYTSPFLRAGPFPLHNILEFNDDFIITYLDFLLDSFEENVPVGNWLI